MYYNQDTRVECNKDALMLMGVPLTAFQDSSQLAALGWFVIYDIVPEYTSYIEYVTEEKFYRQEFQYVREWRKVPFTQAMLITGLYTEKNKLKQYFNQAFSEIDAKLPRNARGIILSLVDGTFPKEEDAPGITPEQQQRITDVGIMWELEEVAQVNRDMQTELLALEITEDMTLEQAQAITMRIANAQPWLPWRE